MAYTEAARWFLSMLHVATTWQSGSLMKLPVLPGPCMPQPTTPMVMRSEGAGRPSAPSALAGMMVGAATAAAVLAIKRRRELFRSMGLMRGNYAQSPADVRVKTLTCFLRGAGQETSGKVSDKGPITPWTTKPRALTAGG